MEIECYFDTRQIQRVIGYNWVKFLHNFMENISVWTKCNVLFNYVHLILIWFFLLIDNEFDLKITLEDIKSRKSSSILMKIHKMSLFSKSFSVSIKNQPYYPNKEKTYKLFVYNPNFRSKLTYVLCNNFYVILNT